MPQLRAVCPPKLRRMPSGRSLSMTLDTESTESGTKWMRSENWGLV
jgi:hypothetical protein